MPIDVKDDKAPSKLDDKPKSPLDLVKPIQQEYSDDESDEVFGIPKPQDKTVGQPTPSVASFSAPLDSVKPIQQEYSDDESDEEFGIPRPQDKTVGQPTPSVAPFSAVSEKSPLKEADKPKPINAKDDKAPTKLDDKPKSPLDSVKPFQQEYSDDESAEEFAIPKPQDKTVAQPTPSTAPFSAVSENLL
ncbi:muscle M-line assembly protein unc-89-like [Drosophila serrata]|uniref:muscle M-line assembly protein unc-89-like n=1 Tax=Drosophila serrata TaxID=7274 RepID=UPI000A1D2459|nr:muscle M-line assembly protein unc-89-like [Drosophila serrata]